MARGGTLTWHEGSSPPIYRPEASLAEFPEAVEARRRFTVKTETCWNTFFFRQKEGTTVFGCVSKYILPNGGAFDGDASCYKVKKSP